MAKKDEQEKEQDTQPAEAQIKEPEIGAKVQIVIKSLPYNGRYGFRYRENSVQEVDRDEADELVKAGIADYVTQAGARHVYRGASAISTADLAQKQAEARSGENQTGTPIEDPFSHKQEGPTGGDEPKKSE